MTRPLAACLLIVGVVVATYWPTLRNDFVNWDDQSEITENPDFNPVTVPGLAWNWSHTRLTLYMPVTYMAWGAVATVAPRDGGKLSPVAFHGLSLFLHAACSVLVFALIRKIAAARPVAGGRQNWTTPALLGAIVFAVHPLQVEPVAWASGMYTLLSTGWSLAALICYVNHARRLRDQPRNFRRGWFALATLFYVLALLTKASSVAVPVVAGVIDVLLIGRNPWRSVRSLWIWLAMGVPVVWAAKAFQDLSNVPAPPAWARPIVATDAIAFYLGKLVWPVDFIPDYGRNPTFVMAHLPATVAGAVCGFLFLVVAWESRRRAVWVAAGAAVFVAGVGPYLGLTTFDFQYVSTVADRYAYFGMTGVAMAVAAVVAARPAARWAVVAVAGVWVGVAQFQTGYWHDTVTLFDRTLAVNNRSLVAKNVLGFLAARDGRYEEAEWYYVRALRVWPEDAVIHFNLGNLYGRPAVNRPDLAINEYRMAVRYQPRFAVYRNSLAATLARVRRLPEAIDQWRQAVDDDPRYVDARNNLATAYLQAGAVDSAVSQYRAVLSIDPENSTARRGLIQLANADRGPK